MLMHYMYFLVGTGYLLWISRPYMNVFKAGDFHKLCAAAPLAVAFDGIEIVIFIYTNIMWIYEYLGMPHSLGLSVALQLLFAAVALHRLNGEDIASIQARINQGEQA